MLTRNSISVILLCSLIFKEITIKIWLRKIYRLEFIRGIVIENMVVKQGGVGTEENVYEKKMI